MPCKLELLLQLQMYKAWEAYKAAQAAKRPCREGACPAVLRG